MAWICLDTEEEWGSEIEAVITAPLVGSNYEVGAEVNFEGTVSDSAYAASELMVAWSSATDGPLGSSTPAEDGGVVFKTSALSGGPQLITMKVTNPVGKVAVATLELGICTWSSPVGFDTDISGSAWKIYGDAYWDSDESGEGWLEMTGVEPPPAAGENYKGRKGAIFNIQDMVTPGDVQINFKIRTGGGAGGGADGFAMSVIEAKSIEELDTIMNHPTTGGCLGYAVANCPKNPTEEYPHLDITAFHVEFDTFHNVDNPITDPTFENHVGVMLNGDAGDHKFWSSFPGNMNIEDLQWHSVSIAVTGTNVSVTVDAQELINGDIENLDFRGGFIGFSGTTGGKTNYHSFDDLEIIQQCLVE